jgi:hypothetical protein
MTQNSSSTTTMVQQNTPQRIVPAEAHQRYDWPSTLAQNKLKIHALHAAAAATLASLAARHHACATAEPNLAAAQRHYDIGLLMHAASTHFNNIDA